MRKGILCLLFAFWTLHASAQTIVPSQTDEIIIDNGTSGEADPNDRIRYQVTIQNTGGAPAEGVQLNAVPDPRTTLVPGTFRSSPLAVPDMYASTGNVGISVPVAQGVKANDFDDNLPAATLSCGACTSVNGGTVVLNNNGSFTYTPPAGFTGSDSFTYTITDGNPVGLPVPTTDMTSVTITVSNMIWFISNGSGGSGGTGTRIDPFRTMADFNAATGPLAGHIVHIQHTGTDYAGGIVLKDDMIVIGTGHTGGVTLADVLPFSLAPNSPTLPAINAMRPVITNAGGDGVTLAQNNNLRGFNVGNCSDFGMENSGTNSIGNLVVSEVSINNATGGGFDGSHGSGAAMNALFDAISTSGGANGINLVGAAGAFTGTTGSMTNPTGAGIAIVNGSVTFSYGGDISDNSGTAVLIDNHDSGNVTLSGNINSTGAVLTVQNCGGGTKTFSGATKAFSTGASTAISLTNNAGATINFTGGGLAITTSSGMGFTATGGGTVSVTGANNTIVSTTGVALNIASTTIGAGNVTFRSISVNGAPNGIVLNTTGTSGGLVVTGTGTTDGSGGTIQNITNRGVSATSTSNLSLGNMTFTNANTADAAGCNASDNTTCNAAVYMNTVTNAAMDNVDINGAAQQGINLREVNGFQLLNSTVINGGAGGQTEEADLYAQNIFGNITITNSSLTVPAERAAVIYNTSKTMTLTVTGSTFGLNQSQPLGADGLEMDFFGACNSTINITGCTFTQPKTNGLQVITDGTSYSNVNVSNSTFNPGAGLAAAIDLVTNGSGDMDFNIVNNPLIKSRGINTVNIFGFAGSKFEGRVNNNTINVGDGAGSGAGVRVVAQGNFNSLIEIKNNNITGADDHGITNVASLGSGRLDVTATGNTISLSNSGFYGVHTAAGVSSSTFTNKVCANVASNITTAVPAGAIGNFQARAATASHEILLQGTGANVATIWNNNSNTPISPPAIISQSGVGTFTFGATCNIPAN